MNVEIKLGIIDDVGIAHKLMIQAFDEYRLLEVPSSAINERVDSLRKSFLSGREKFILCIFNGIPSGSSRFILKEDSLYFSRVSVLPNARGNGLAKEMIRWLEEFAKKEGKNKIECRVRRGLSNNIRLYESLGFEIAKEEIVTNPNGFKVQTAVMEKLLIVEALS